MPDPTEYAFTMPRITVSVTVKQQGQGELVSVFQVEPHELSRERMDEIEQLVGNGLARVSVSADMGILEFGTGAKAMCTVSLTCNQDLKTVDRAYRIAADLARDYANEQRARGEQELMAIVAQRQGATGGSPNYRGG